MVNFPDNTWVEVINLIHGPDGGLSRPSAARRRSGCWGTIVSFSNHFQLVTNAIGSSKWTWSLDPSRVYTVSSMRSHIDNLVLTHSDGRWNWNPLVPGKWITSLWDVGSQEKFGFKCEIGGVLDSSHSSCRGLLDCKSRIGGHQRLLVLHEAIMLVFLWVVWRYINALAHGPSIKSHTVLASEVQVLSHLWINARKRRGQNLSWYDWCFDPVLECYRKL
uniref:Uncharacterized protein n=1 Tax=Lactuca sativa TaxID=4236 RepID=A0A9R1XJJ9_LACSA|nr:hypothetical protein LSAT_V11C400158780 [Lactuca sativa]